MVFIFIHSFVSVSSFIYLLYFIFCGTNWAEQEESSDTGPQHLIYFLNVLVPWERKHSEQGQKERPQAFSDLYIFSSHTRSIFTFHFTSILWALLLLSPLLSLWLCLWFLPPSLSGASVMHPPYYSSCKDRLGSLASVLWTLNDSVSPERPLFLSTFQQLIISLPNQLKCHFLRGSYSGNSI